MASFQMEYAYLGKITGKKEHVDRVCVLVLPCRSEAKATLQATLITNLLYDAKLNRSGGMYPTYWNLNLGVPSGGESLASDLRRRVT